MSTRVFNSLAPGQANFKTTGPVKERLRYGRMKRAGKKVKAWESERAKLKVRFAAMGITTCEAKFPHECWKDSGLSFAHALKRRNLKPHQLGEVALLCINAHNIVEILPEPEMAKVVRGIIKERRDLAPT